MIEVRPTKPIYRERESVSPGECYKHIYMATPLSVEKKAKNGIFFQKKDGATGLKLWHANTI